MGSTSSPWGKIQPLPETIDFKEIMSEEVARGMQIREEQRYVDYLDKQTKREPETVPELLSFNDNNTCDSDEIIARMLQDQFDRDHDIMLKKTEKKFNGTSKLQLSYANYRTTPENLIYDSDEYDEAEDPGDKKDWDTFETVEKEFNSIPRCGYKIRPEGTMITKHDTVMAGRRNACRVMAFPPEFQTGDGAGFDMRLNNKVYNNLKSFARTEESRRHKFHDKKEDRATAEFGVDCDTALLLYKFVNNKLLEQVNGVISIGKEAVVLHADSDPTYTEQVLPKECAIKIFKTTLSEYKQRDKYIKDDYRFKDRFSKQNSRKAIHLWAEKEMCNINRMQKVGIPCPEVVCLKKNILVMSFIGANNRAALKLKDAVLQSNEIIDAYGQVTESMKKLYKEARLVHSDLSEYNILWHDGVCYFIDVSQAVECTHPSAYEFLLRDCGNISRFFTRKGVPETKSPEELFVEITGLASSTAIEMQRNKIKSKPHLVDKPGIHNQPYNFDHAWEEIQNLRADKIKGVNEIDSVNLVEPPKA